MKAQRLVFPEANKCEMETFDIPDQLEAGRVLLKNLVSLVSPGTELSLFCGTHRALPVPENKWAKYPFRPGYAAIGEVQADTGTLKKGDRVMHWGPHATYATPTVAEVTLVPKELDVEIAPFLRMLQISMTTIRLAPVKVGERVLVIGQGIVGNFAAQLYNQCGAIEVIGAERSKGRIAKAKACGITTIFDTTNKTLAELFAETKTPAPELVVEAIGLAPTITDALKIVARRGRVVLLGSPRKVQEFDPYFDIHAKGTILIGAHGAHYDAAQMAADVPLLWKWLHTEKIKVRPMITHRINQQQALTIYPNLRDNPEEYMGVIIKY